MSRKLLSELLELVPHELVTLTGGGGKTSLLWRLCEEISFTKAKAVAATTTKMYYPKPFKGPIFLSEKEQNLLSKLKKEEADCFFLAYKKIEGGKVAGVLPETLDALYNLLPNRSIINEGDGAAGKSCKFYRAEEPVIPKATTRIIHVIGCDIWGQSLSPRNLHRCPAAFEGKIFDEVVLRAHLQDLKNHIAGHKKATLDLLINKADRDQGNQAAAIKALAADYFDHCIVASLKEGFWQ